MVEGEGHSVRTALRLRRDKQIRLQYYSGRKDGIYFE